MTTEQQKDCTLTYLENKGQLRELGVSSLRNDPKYQRSISLNRIRRIVKEFIPHAVGVIIVSKRDGNYYIIDGQHRYHVLLQKNIKTVQCLVYENLTIEEEARLFDIYNSNRGQVTALSRFNAKLIYQDPAALHIQSILECVGLKVSTQCSSGKASGSKKGAIQAVSALERVYHKYGPEILRRSLTILNESYGGSSRSLTQRMIVGMATVYAKFPNKISDERMVSVLKSTPISELQREGAVWEKTIGENDGMARIIHTRYNKKLTVNRLADW